MRFFPAGMRGQPPPPPSGGGGSCQTYIDLDALVQSTIMNNSANSAGQFTKEFSQHWIVVGKDLRVLLFDFNGFTLLIPSPMAGQAFR